MANKYLVLGRAGSGKTHFVLDKFLEFVKEHKEKNALFLLPTHSQVEHLKDVILKKFATANLPQARPVLERSEGWAVKGFLDVSFFTFGSLARWMWESGGVRGRESRVISEGLKDLLLKNILHKHRVTYFDEVYDTPGFRHAILKFIKELKENSLSPRQFEAIIPLTPFFSPKGRGEGTEKYAGLASTYARYQQALEDHGLLDTEDLLNDLFNKLFPPPHFSPPRGEGREGGNLKSDSTLLANKKILLVDGFHDFTPIEFKILTLLIQRIPEVYITLPLDPNLREKQVPVFQTTARTYNEPFSLNLKEIALYNSYRTHKPTLRHVERNLFRSFASLKDRKHRETIDADDSIGIIEAANIRDEVDQIARRIYEMVTDGDACTERSECVRYKDIGVILRDVDKYCDLIENIFPRYGIPVRIYAYMGLRENYAVRAVLNLVNIFRENWKDKWVIKVLKSDYFGLDKELVDEFEHKALKKGIISSRKGWLALAKERRGKCHPDPEQSEGEGSRLSKERDSSATPQNDKGVGQNDKSEGFKQIKQFFDMLVELENGIQTNQAPSFFREWFLNVIANLSIVRYVRNTISNVLRKPLIPGVSGENTIKRDVAAIKTFTALLDDVVRACEIEEIEELRFHEFIEKLLPLLDVSTYSIKDKRDDVVNVIDAMEARQWELPIVFVGGLLEREFPKQVRENLFLKDKVRKELNAQNGIHLKEELKGGEEERYLFYIAVTRARERLFLSYPTADDTGNKNLPSFFLLEVKKLFTKDNYARIANRRSLSQAVHNVDDILTHRDLKDYVFYQLNAPYRKGSPEEKTRNLTLWFYNQLHTEKGFIEEIRIALENRCKAFIESNSLIDKLKEANICYSATQLNDYAQCPFLHFYKHVLKLEKPPSLTEEGLDSARQGTIIHKTLEKYLKAKSPLPPFSKGGKGGFPPLHPGQTLKQGGEVDIFEVFEKVFEEYTKGLNIGFKELKIKGELEAAIKTFIEGEKDFAELYKLKPLYFEERFGNGGGKSKFEGLAFPSVVINDEEIGAIRLQGKIDRIDVTELEDTLVGVVLDYKYSKMGFNKEKDEEILQGLDLQLPIYILAARMLFNIVPIGAEFYTLKTIGRSGLLNKDFVEKGILPSETPRTTKILDTSQFESLMDDCKNRIVKYVKEIVNGNIAIKPANPDRCGSNRCDFADVCRFEKWMIKESISNA